MYVNNCYGIVNILIKHENYKQNEKFIYKNFIAQLYLHVSNRG